MAASKFHREGDLEMEAILGNYIIIAFNKSGFLEAQIFFKANSF